MSAITWHYVFKFIITGDAAVGKSSLLVRLTDQRFLANPDPTLGVEFGSKLITIPDENKIVKLQCEHLHHRGPSRARFLDTDATRSLSLCLRYAVSPRMAGWDTAGTESFRSITRSYYRGAAGCLLVYDVTSRKSFTNARSWLADVRAHADPHLTCILVGNKVDLCPPAPSPSSPSASTVTTSATTTADRTTTTTTSTTPARRREVPTEEAAQWAAAEGLLFVEASAKSGQGVEDAFVRAASEILAKIRSGAFDDNRSPGVKLSKPAGDIALEQEGGGGRGACCS
ncbi:putative rab subfamily of small GTPases [Lyophyllum shimeji]|uniref:Rab subfamily of small GTPases n=1 Tax=Lyophyllum shimeji TaxID=47721 RepID=A0A9P3PFI2_LYOSH|nr:putative rab subfamily of small GTPases [Lyophyllum shimeji]